jgi:type IV secretory pathway VirB2 component (pilin)
MHYSQNHKVSRFSLSNFIFTILCFSFFALEAYAGLEKAKTVLGTIKEEILSIVPIIAVIALIGLGIGYSTGFVQKETLWKWVAGLIIVGSAAQITSMLVG